MSDRESVEPMAAATRESEDVDSRELNYEEGPLAKGNAKCTDSCFLAGFVLFWCGGASPPVLPLPPLLLSRPPQCSNLCFERPGAAATSGALLKF